MENQENLNEEIKLNSENKQHLLVASKWAYFLAILNFIAVGFLIIAGVILSISSMFIPQIEENSIFAFIGPLYIVLAVVYFFPAYYLFQFASKTKLALLKSSQMDFDQSLLNQKKIYQFIGISSIVLIAAYILTIVGIIIAVSMKMI